MSGMVSYGMCPKDKGNLYEFCDIACVHTTCILMIFLVRETCSLYLKVFHLVEGGVLFIKSEFSL